MSEYLNNQKERIEKLMIVAHAVISADNARKHITDNQDVIETITAEETMEVLDILLQEDIPFETIKDNTGKLLNVFYKSLNSIEWEKPSEGHLLTLLMQENREAEKIMETLREELKACSKSEDIPAARLLKLVKELKQYELHYIKKENVIFPVIEATFPKYRCLSLMWSFHDDFRDSLNVLEELLTKKHIDKGLMNNEFGRLFFVVLPIIFREEQIVFPIALKSIPEKTWNDLLWQCDEIGWSYIDAPSKVVMSNKENKIITGQVDLGTGFLTAEQIMLMLNNLPVDITFVDENDEVRYFSGSNHRIFQRSKAIIGRKVQNCHPHESVHIVNNIIDSFKEGTRSVAEFWIQIKGRFIHIRYFALRDENHNYKGTIEVSQDATGIRELRGEKRLLDD